MIHFKSAAHTRVKTSLSASPTYQHDWIRAVDVEVPVPAGACRRDGDYLIMALAYRDPWFDLRRFRPLPFNSVGVGYPLPYGDGDSSNGMNLVRPDAWIVPGNGDTNPIGAFSHPGVSGYDTHGAWVAANSAPLYLYLDCKPAAEQEAQSYTFKLLFDASEPSWPATDWPKDLDRTLIITAVMACYTGAYIEPSGASIYRFSWHAENHTRVVKDDATEFRAAATLPVASYGFLEESWIAGAKAVHIAVTREPAKITPPAGLTARYQVDSGPSILIADEECAGKECNAERSFALSTSTYALGVAFGLEQRPRRTVRIARHPVNGRLYSLHTTDAAFLEYAPEGDPYYGLNRKPNELWLHAHGDVTPEQIGSAVWRNELRIAEAPVNGAALSIRASGEIDVLFAQWGVVQHVVSRDGGKSFAMAATVAEGFDDVVLAQDPDTGMLVAMLFRVTNSALLNGEWCVSVGSVADDGSITWSSPRVAVSGAKPGSATLIRRMDGVWEFAYTHASTDQWVFNVDQRIARCKGLLPNGTGAWE